MKSPLSTGDSARLLGFLVIASIVVPSVLFAGFAWLSYRQALSEAQVRLDQTLDVVHEHASKVFETHELVALHVRDILLDVSDGGLRAREAEFYERLSALKQPLPQVEDIWVIDAKGSPMVTATTFPAPRNLDLSDRVHFAVHRQSGTGSYISEVMQSRVRQGSFFLLTQRWEDDLGGFRGVVGVSIDPKYFRQFYSRFPEGYVSSLVREDGAILSRYPGNGNGTDRLPPDRGLMAEIARAPQQGRYSETSGVDGVERIAAYRRLPLHPLYVTANYGLPDIRHTWLVGLLSHLTLAAPATLGLFLISLLAFGQARRERQAVQQLRQEVTLRQSTEAQLRQAQKMEAVGRLTGGIAHDFNNLLTVIKGNLETVMRQLPDASDRVRRALDNAQKGAERAASLTHRLLAFSRQQPLEVKTVDLNQLVAGMSDLLRRTIGESIAIEFRLGAGVWTTLADPNQIENALLNLVINARDAMPDGGRLTIETSNVRVETDEDTRLVNVPRGLYAALAVSDSGTGMAPDVLEKVFDPFFTTKPVGQGTGLGLSMVYGFMQQSGGHVRILSQVGEGTSVRLYFQRLEEASERAPAPTTKPSIPVEPVGNGESILLVEDDENVRNFSADTLRDLGYRVVEATDLNDALTKLDDNPDIQALFTDVVLAGDGNGRELADEARRRRPDLRVLFTTGYTRNAIVHDGRVDPDVEFLQKPFSAAALGLRMRALFDAQ